MRRIVLLNEAITALKNPYTFSMDRSFDANQTDAQKKITGMSITILEKMRDSQLEQAYSFWEDARRSGRIKIDPKGPKESP